MDTLKWIARAVLKQVFEDKQNSRGIGDIEYFANSPWLEYWCIGAELDYELTKKLLLSEEVKHFEPGKDESVEIKGKIYNKVEFFDFCSCRTREEIVQRFGIDYNCFYMLRKKYDFPYEAKRRGRKKYEDS